MKIALTLLLIPFWITCSKAQQRPEAMIHHFFQAMYDIDTSYLRSSFLPEATLASTLSQNNEGKVVFSDIDRFIASVAKSKPGDLNEKIYNLRTEKKDGLAQVWMDYSFYYQGALHHCGVNNFTLGKSGEQWKIIHLSDTRQNDDCSNHELIQKLNTLLDNWHLAAANADSTSYFNMMATDAIYVGTDPAEVWTKRAFTSFAAPYFAKGKAWDFKKINRNIYIMDDDRMVYFDELIDTWMGPCRGSGVMALTSNGWKIQHYVLSVTVSNDDIDAFLEINKK